MLVFSTRIPLKETTTQEDFLALCIRWVTESPHYHIDIKDINYDLSSHDDFDYTKENNTFSIRHYKNDDKVKISACRLENCEENIIWTNDCILLDEGGLKSVLIQLNCIQKNFSTKLPFIHKPYVVRMFVQSGMCGMDSGIPTTDTAITINEDNYSTCLKIVNGTFSYSMPVVYISHDYWDRSVISSDYLAKQLSGMAHILEETSLAAQRLREDAPECRVYGGYVGLYFPDAQYCRRFGKEYYTSSEKMLWDIVNSVKKSLANRLDSTYYNWNQILTLQARQKIDKIDKQGKEQLDAYIDNFDKEQEQYKDKINELNEEICRLNAEMDSMRNRLYMLQTKSTGDGFYKRGVEQELYPGEANELLYSILSQIKSYYPEKSRAVDLINSMLEANPRTGSCEDVIDLVREALTGGNGKLTKTAKSKLKEAGFSIKEDGPHYKITFYDARYMFTVSKTPEDHREGKNLFSNIRNVIDVERKLR